MQYITNEAGERVGVVLDWTTYQTLTVSLSQDPELLQDLSISELQTLAQVSLGLDGQTELSQLLEQSRQNHLSPSDQERLDQLLEQIDQLNILKARALYTLQHRSTQSAV
jgi:hypothetical protein